MSIFPMTLPNQNSPAFNTEKVTSVLRFASIIPTQQTQNIALLPQLVHTFKHHIQTNTNPLAHIVMQALGTPEIIFKKLVIEG